MRCLISHMCYNIQYPKCIIIYQNSTARLTSDVWRVWRMILKSCAWCLISKCYVWLASGGRLAQCFEKLRLMGVWRASGAMFQNQASHATFQNLPPDVIFCDHASDVYHEWYSVCNHFQKFQVAQCRGDAPHGLWKLNIWCPLLDEPLLRRSVLIIISVFANMPIHQHCTLHMCNNCIL